MHLNFITWYYSTEPDKSEAIKRGTANTKLINSVLNISKKQYRVLYWERKNFKKKGGVLH